MIPNVASFVSSLLPSTRQPARVSASLENPSTDINDPELWESMGHSSTPAGINVGPEEALKFGPVFQCLEIKSADIGSATLHVHKNEVPDGEDDVDYDQPCETCCSLEWNETTPANEGWQNLVFHQGLWGSGYAYIARDGGSPNGRIMWMANLVPTNVEPVHVEGLGLMYRLTLSDGQHQFLNRWEVFHLRGLAIQPNRPLQLLHLMRTELGLALAAKQWLSKFFARGGHHGGILTLPPGMKKAAMDNLEKGVAKRADPASWFKTLILRDGAQWQSATVDPRTAQMHEMSDDEARAVCHFFNMPPWKLGIRDSESYNSAEQAVRAYITGTLLHVSTRIKGEATLKLLNRRTRRARSHRFEHDFTALLQTDVKTLNEVMEIQRRNEIISGNEWRRRINMPRRVDEKADQFYNPNTKSDKRAAGSDSTGDTTSTDSGTTSTGNGAASNREREIRTELPPTTDVPESYRRLLCQAAERAAKRLATVASNKAKRPNELLAWVDAAGAEHREIVPEETAAALSVVLERISVSAADDGLSSLVTMASKTWFMDQVTKGVGQFLEAPHKPAELRQNVATWCESWLTNVGESFFSEIVRCARVGSKTS